MRTSLTAPSREGHDDSIQQHIEAVLRSANEQYQRQDFRAARETLQLLDRLQAHTAETLQTVGNLSLLLGEPGPAGEAFRRALALQPENVNLLVALALVDLRAQNEPDRNGFLQRALALDPENPDGLKLLADWYLCQARYVEAASVYGRLIAKDPTRVEICLALVKCFFETGDRATAESTLEYVLQLEPGNALACENLKALRARRAQPDRVTLSARKAVTEVSPSAVEWLQYADSAYNRGDLAEACELLHQVLAQAPDFVPARVGLGNVQFQLGQYAPALESYSAALALEPDSVELLVRVAVTAVRCKEVPRFEQALARALELDPDHLGALRLLADLNLQVQQFAEAAPRYRRIAQKTPHDTEVLLALGRCEYALGHWVAARRAFEQALEFNPNLELAQENLCIVKQRLAQETAQAFHHRPLANGEEPNARFAEFPLASASA